MKPDGELKYPDWQNVYQEAVLELDKSRLKERVLEAEVAILRRQRTLSRNPEDLPERNAIVDALAVLLTLKQTELEYPEWKSQAR